MTTQEIIGWVLTGLVSASIIMSGAMKLAGGQKVTEALGRVNVLPYRVSFALVEIMGAVLFLIPSTSTIGFILLICYFSGALATDLSHNSPFVPPLVLLCLIFVAGFIRNPSIFGINL